MYAIKQHAINARCGAAYGRKEVRVQDRAFRSINGKRPLSVCVIDCLSSHEEVRAHSHVWLLVGRKLVGHLLGRKSVADKMDIPQPNHGTSPIRGERPCPRPLPFLLSIHTFPTAAFDLST